MQGFVERFTIVISAFKCCKRRDPAGYGRPPDLQIKADNTDPVEHFCEFGHHVIERSCSPLSLQQQPDMIFNVTDSKALSREAPGKIAFRVEEVPIEREGSSVVIADPTLSARQAVPHDSPKFEALLCSSTSNMDRAIKVAGGARIDTPQLTVGNLKQYVMAPLLASAVKDKLPHVDQQLCHDILGMSQHFARIGLSDGQRARGFMFICGESSKLLEVCTDETDGESFEYGVVGHSIVGDDHVFHGNSIYVTEWRKHLQAVSAAVQQDGAVVVDCKTGRLVSMRYMVSDISRGDSSSGARHQSASSIAINERAGRCFVVKASEDVTNKGSGNLDVFPGQRRPVLVPIH